MSEWIRVADQLPPEGEVVETKIDDKLGIRNVQSMFLLRRLWFIPKSSVYAYYTPTHWRRLPDSAD